MKSNKDKMMDKFESLLSQHEAYLNMNKWDKNKEDWEF